MSKRKPTPTICAEPGCAEEREWCKRRNVYRSRYCARHRRARDNEARPSLMPDVAAYQPREVLAAWRSDKALGDLYLDGLRVYGLNCQDGIYYAQVAGAMEGVRLRNGDVLSKVRS